MRGIFSSSSRESGLSRDMITASNEWFSRIAAPPPTSSDVVEGPEPETVLQRVRRQRLSEHQQEIANEAERLAVVSSLASKYLRVSTAAG